MKGKMLIIATAIVGLSFSCRHENDIETKQRIRFELCGLDLVTADMAPRRVEDVITPEQAAMTDIWVWEGSALLAHQVSTDADFGAPSIELDYGQHSLSFVASDQTGQAWSAGVWSADRANNCYGVTHAMSVDGSTGEQAVVLGRVAYGLKWQTTDLVPSGVQKVRVTIDEYRCSLGDGLVGGEESVKVWEYNLASYVGRTVSVTVYGLPAQLGVEETIHTSIEFLNGSDAVVYEHEKDVPVLSNRMSIVTGAMFSGSAGASIRLNQEWLDAYETGL